MKQDMSTTKFLNLFDKGIGKANRYQVRFILPKGIPQSEWANIQSTSGRIQSMQSQLNGNEAINIFCHTCVLPQRSVMTYEHRQMTAPYLLPLSQRYEPIPFSFFSDSTMNTRRYFEVWQNTVLNIHNNTMNFYSEYVADVEIRVLDAQGNPTYGIKLVEAYPMSLPPVDLSYSNNAVQNVTVVMTYKYWENLEDLRETNVTK